MEAETFGARLRAAIERSKLTQAAVAQILHVSHGTVEGWLSGYRVPSYLTQVGALYILRQRNAVYPTSTTRRRSGRWKISPPRGPEFEIVSLLAWIRETFPKDIAQANSRFYHEQSFRGYRVERIDKP